MTQPRDEKTEAAIEAMGFALTTKFQSQAFTVLLARIAEKDTEIARLAAGHDEYNRVNRILEAENDHLREITLTPRQAKHLLGDRDVIGWTDDEEVLLAMALRKRAEEKLLTLKESNDPKNYRTAKDPCLGCGTTSWAWRSLDYKDCSVCARAEEGK